MTSEAAKADVLDLALAPEERPAAPPAAPSKGRSRRPWDRMRFRVRASLGPATTAAVTSATVGDGLAAPVSPPKRAKKGWREQRWERRRRRVVFEEVLAWVLVPTIVVSAYWGVQTALSAFGTSPSALIEGIKAVIASRP